MEKILEQLYIQYGKSNTGAVCLDEEQRISARRGNLKKVLTDKQYNQLFWILNDASLIESKMSVLNFASGVRFGIKFMTEIYAECGQESDF